MFECDRQSFTPRQKKKRSAVRWFRSRENSRAGTPRFGNALALGRSASGPCLEMVNMEQSTTAALLLLIKNLRHQAAQHKTVLLLRVATHQCRCVHVRSRLSRRAAVALIAAARLKAQARDTKTATKHKTTPPLHDPRASHSSPAFIKCCERSAVRVVVHT